MILNIITIFLLIKDYGHLGIALALSLSSWLNAIILYTLLYFKGYGK